MSVSNIDPNINRGISTLKNNSPKSVNSKQVDDTKYIPQQFKDVAESMESQFAETMLKQMEQTIDESSPEESGGGMDYYKSLQTAERAKMMSQQNNLGLQKVILDQVYPKRLRNEMALKQYEAQSNLIHQNLPSYKIAQKADTINMGKNDSTSLSKENNPLGQTREGGLP